MTCEEALLLISGQIDEANTEEEAAQLREHLENCQECRELLETFQKINADILELKEEAPDDLCAGVMAAVRKETRVKRRKHRAWMNVAAAVFVTVVGVSVIAAPFVVKEEAPAAETMSMRSVTDAVNAQKAATASLPVEGSRAISSYACTADAAGEILSPQELADQRGVPVAVVPELYSELETCEVEQLEDGTLLYILPDRNAAQELCEEHAGEVFQPEDPVQELDISYAVVLLQ